MQAEEFDALRLLAYDRIKACLHGDSGSWSVQGLGMLRTYVGPRMNNSRTSYRLHVWHQSLRIPGVTMLHNHPWDLHSTVLAGRVQQRRYHIACDGSGEPYMRQRILCGEDAETTSQPELVYLASKDLERYGPGENYHQEASEIHASFPDDGTVTIVRRHVSSDDADHADVFYPEHATWVDAAPHGFDPIGATYRIALSTAMDHLLEGID